MRPGYLAKRALDYAFATGGLLACGPAMLAIAVAIRLESEGGALFVQERLGKGGKTFKLLKFRTMKAAPIMYNPDGSTRVDAADARVTRVGKYLRGAIDELPQLINILLGDMSLIGPRPDMASQRSLYSADEDRKLEALPGITSLAVVLGRNDLPWKQRIQIDIRYIDSWSLGLDFKIFAQTLLMPLGLRAFDFMEVLQGVGVDHS
ncbi:MAG: Undecaprenyl-phosphate galactose phosphotransferase [Myxococcales bacterium]|nr:Undecaprenyl-phosphate galactose phosphotransferase [Myxococcales bacterium]